METSEADLYTTTKGQWQWKSNQDPWSKSEEPRWTSYPPQQNYLIEKAYYDQQKEVDLGDYIVFLKHMLQRKKSSIASQRPIRRIAQSETENNERSKRYLETELPKTISPVFGTLEDLVNYFSTRNPEIFRFATQFKEIEERHDLDALNQIIPILISSFQKEWKKTDSEETLKDSISLFRKKMKEKMDQRNQELISIFQKQFSSFDEFYGCVLKAYTMNTFLYQNLNEYLRNEDWSGLDHLLPYAFCLFKAFFSFKKDSNLNQDLSLEVKEPKAFTIYRGTALNESALSHFNPERSRHFTWNAATSATRDLDVANQFMYMNTDIPKKKYPVLFILEVPALETNVEYSRYLDLAEPSVCPQEHEVVLAPACVFELLEVSRDKNDIITIRSKLLGDEHLESQGLMTPIALESEITPDQIIQTKGLDSKYSLESLKPPKAELPKTVRPESSDDVSRFFSEKNPPQVKSAKQAHEMKAIERGFWQRKFNAEWVFYSFELNELIEEAYHQQRDIEIENYIVSPLSLIQIEKGNPKATIPIRRISWIENEETDSILERYLEKELPKSIDNGFGNLSNFLTFIKSLEIGSFMKEFEEIEASDDVGKLNQEIVPKIQACFQNEVEKASLDKPSESDISSLVNCLKAQPELSYEEKILAIQNILKGKMEKRCRQLTQLFAQEFGSFQSFYECILKAYTTTTFLHLNLNKFLRDEAWDRLHALLPYLFCFCKAFFSLKKGVENDLKAQAPQEQEFLTVFRGLCLDEFALSFYNPEKMKIFSYTSITSTTTNPQVAKYFMDMDFNGKDKIHRVLFKILIPVIEKKEFEYLNYLKMEHSARPNEDEVILPPASVFELKDKEFEENQITITLELKSDFQCIKRL